MLGTFSSKAARHVPCPAIQVLASDLDAGALAIAREGRYPSTIENYLDDERLRGHYQACQARRVGCSTAS